MSRQLRNTLTLKDGAVIAVLGGAPAGSFFAIHLLRQAREANKDIRVTIIDKRITLGPNGNVQEFKGCNFCAGIISPRLQTELRRLRIKLPREVICEKITHIWIHGLWKNFPLRVPAGQEVVSVFRGSLPLKRKGLIQGFDTFLLKKAVEQGADIISGEVLDIQYTPENKPRLTIKPSMGDIIGLESDFACICTGINPNPGQDCKEDALSRSFQKLNPLFSPPKSRHSLIFALKPGSLYLKKYMNKELYFIISGSKKLNLEHVALIPKREYLTIALCGKSIDRASSPEDIEQIIKTFMSLPHFTNILPHITLKNTPVVCSCSPYMAVMPAKEPFSDRIALAGDALGARLYRDGLFSAFISAQALAKTVIHKGVDKKSLADAYGWVTGWLKKIINMANL